MDRKLKIAAVAGGALLLLLGIAGTSGAAPTPPPDPNPDPKPDPDPKPNRGPHPPPWPGLPTATVKVSGGYTGVRLRSSPSTTAPEVVAYDRGGVYNGRRIAVLEEFVEENGRLWARIYSPTGYEGWSSMVDPQGNRNLWYDDIPDVAQVPVGFVPGERSTEDVLPPGLVPADIGGGHGWYPYGRPAQAARRADPRGGRGLAFRPEGAEMGGPLPKRLVRQRRGGANIYNGEYVRASDFSPLSNDAHPQTETIQPEARGAGGVDPISVAWDLYRRAWRRVLDSRPYSPNFAMVAHALYQQYANLARRAGLTPHEEAPFY